MLAGWLQNAEGLSVSQLQSVLLNFVSLSCWIWTACPSITSTASVLSNIQRIKASVRRVDCVRTGPRHDARMIFAVAFASM